MTTPTDAPLRVRDVARRLGVIEDVVRRWIHRGLSRRSDPGPRIRLAAERGRGRAWEVRPAALASFVRDVAAHGQRNTTISRSRR